MGTGYNQVVNISGGSGASGSGTPGAPGTNGLDGKSAYELAVAGGFVGTEATWLTSLTGTNGIIGSNGKGWTGVTYDSTTGIVTFASTDGLGSVTGDIRGAQGVAGIQGGPGLSITGPAGKDGKDGTDGTNGTGVTIKGSDTLGSIQLKNGTVGDMWIDSATGNGWVSDGTTGTASWVNVGPIKGPQGVQGQQGTQGIDGVGINVLPPVPDDAARIALSTSWTTADAGKSVLQIDTGDFWTYDGTQWAAAGHLVGPQGIDGPQGVKGLDGTIGTTGQDGKDGTDGTDGTGVTIKGSDAEATIQAITGAPAGDMWLINDIGPNMGHGLVSDGNGNWTDVGSIQGPKGIQGVQGIQGIQGLKGDDFVGKLIDDLTTGGTTDSLSAEQGKVLKGLTDTNETNIANFIAQKAAASGLATLDGNQKLTSSQLPNFTISQVYVVPDIVGRDGLNTGAATSNGGIDTGDIVVVTNIAQGAGLNVHETWMAKRDGANSPADWVEISAPSVMPVKSDWLETSPTSLAYIENKPASLEARVAALETLVTTFMPKSGGIFTGDVTMASGKIIKFIP